VPRKCIEQTDVLVPTIGIGSNCIGSLGEHGNSHLTDNSIAPKLASALDNLVTQLRIPTARDATIAIVQREITASAIISSLALVVRGKVSAGEKAVAFVNARNR